MTLSAKAKDRWSALGAVVATIVSVWIMGVGLYLTSPFFIFAGFFFLIATCLGITFYLLKGTTWRN